MDGWMDGWFDAMDGRRCMKTYLGTHLPRFVSLRLRRQQGWCRCVVQKSGDSRTPLVGTVLLCAASAVVASHTCWETMRLQDVCGCVNKAFCNACCQSTKPHRTCLATETQQAPVRVMGHFTRLARPPSPASVQRIRAVGQRATRMQCRCERVMMHRLGSS